jgi:hypothetical protein
MRGCAVRVAARTSKLDHLASLERLFILIVFGDLLGVPILPPYYALRLLPYIVPSLSTWRRSMLRERDLTDLLDQELG